MFQTTIGGILVTIADGVISWTSGMKIDFDGARNCYAPPGSGLPELDSYQNAYKNGKDPSDGYCGIVTVNGVPIEQLKTDPFPGYWVSTTALQDHSKAISDPARYVDAGKVSYISVPQILLRSGAKLGDVARVFNTHNGRSCPAIVAEVGPHDSIGEGSPPCAIAIGLAGGRKGGAGGGISYEIYLGSSKGWPRDWSEVASQVTALSSA